MHEYFNLFIDRPSCALEATATGTESEVICYNGNIDLGKRFLIDGGNILVY